MDYLLGIDLGTSSTKAIVAGLDGHLLGVGRQEYGIDTPRPGWAEQDPAVWLQATAASVRDALSSAQVDPAAIAAIGLSGQMHTTVCLDRHRAPLRPAIVWADQRSAPQVEEVYRRLGKERLAAWTQNPLAAGFTLATLLWLEENEPELYGRIAHVLLPKDYLRLYLTGELGTEPTDASATLLMDVAEARWSAELLDVCAIDPGILPPIRPSTEVAGRLVREAALALGLPTGIPVIYGSGDQAAQAAGNGVIAPGNLSSTIGTGGQLLAPSDAPAFDPELRLHTFCHAEAGRWFIMAATLAAGLSLNWLRRVLGASSYDELADAASQVPPGAEGLLFLPHLTGERTPYMDPTARGAFAGLALHHGRGHLARAVMEGVVFSLRQGLELILGLGIPVERVIASGGGTRHRLWLQLQADIFGQPIYQTETEEAAALGAALLAGVGAGAYTDLTQACARAVRLSAHVVNPDPGSAERYQRLYRRYAEVYPALHPLTASTDREG